MKIEAVKGNTGVLSAPGFSIPFYRLQEQEWILLDCGSRYQEQELLDLLERENVKIRAVIVSHAHYDHTGNLKVLKQRFGAEVIMSVFDAGVSQDLLGLKATFYSSAISEIRKRYDGMCCIADRILEAGENHIEIDGARFETVNLSGHAACQLGIVTPDQVMYLADSIFGESFLDAQPLIYAFSWKDMLNTLKMLEILSYPYYVAAHSGVYSSLTNLIKKNQYHFAWMFQRFGKLIIEESTIHEILVRVLKEWNMSIKSCASAQVLERIVRSMLEYMQEEGQLKTRVKNGIIVYDPV